MPQGLLYFPKEEIIIDYVDVPFDPFPYVKEVNWFYENLSSSILQSIKRIEFRLEARPPWKVNFIFPIDFDMVLEKFFNVVKWLHNNNEKILAVSVADHFFNLLSPFWQGLIQNRNSKDFAARFLEKTIEKTRTWETTNGFEVHKGTPYFFLTSIFLSMGDVDSAYACTFKAINEDMRSKKSALNKQQAYKNSPAYRYVSLEDNQANYLYNLVSKMRDFLIKQIEQFNTVANRGTGSQIDVSLLDEKLFKNPELEEVMYIFVYSLEKFLKYKDQFGELVIKNNFYKLRNASSIFDFCLVLDKILEHKYGSRFTARYRTLASFVWAYFNDNGWITNVANAGVLKGQMNPSPFDEPDTAIPNILGDNIQMGTNRLNFEMKSMVLAWSLRNWSAHRIESQDIFVEKYYEIINWLIWGIFLSLEVL